MSGATALKIWDRAHAQTRAEFDAQQWVRFTGALDLLNELKLALIDAIDTDEAGAIGQMMQEHRELAKKWSELTTAMEAQPPIQV